MKLNFRTLKAEEIDVKPQTVKQNGFSLLLYKNARVDMDILDETVGPLDWQRKHCRENANCIVSIYDAEKKEWIEKEDTGTESFTEKEKGLASDSFKRACFNWGIGRELYTSPFIWIKGTNYVKEANGKFILTSKFHVAEIEVKNKVIAKLEIQDDKGNTVFAFGDTKNKTNSNTEEDRQKAIRLITKELREEDDEFLETLLAQAKKRHLRECTNEELSAIYKKIVARKGGDK